MTKEGKKVRGQFAALVFNLSRVDAPSSPCRQNEKPQLALVAGAFAGAVEGFTTYPFECEPRQYRPCGPRGKPVLNRLGTSFVLRFEDADSVCSPHDRQGESPAFRQTRPLVGHADPALTAR